MAYKYNSESVVLFYLKLVEITCTHVANSTTKLMILRCCSRRKLELLFTTQPESLSSNYIKLHNVINGFSTCMVWHTMVYE